MYAPFKKIKLQLESLFQEDLKYISQDSYHGNHIEEFSAVEFKDLSCFIEKSFSTYRQKLQMEKKLTDIALHVVHDIRSPLAALNIISQCSSTILGEEKIIIKNAIDRIHDIANDLLENYSPKKMSISLPDNNLTFEIKKEVNFILSEKKVQFSNLPINFVFESTCAQVSIISNIDPAEFKRIISNIINNSVEAMNGSGNVIVLLTSDNTHAHIKIKDDGCGIPSDILPTLLTHPASFGKKQGYGLGLKHAISTIKSWNGVVEIESEFGRGTSVSISLPIYHNHNN